MLSCVIPLDVSLGNFIGSLVLAVLGSWILRPRNDYLFIFPGLHTNYSLMEELIACKKAVGKVVPRAPSVRSFSLVSFTLFYY